MRKQIERLEHHADLAPDTIESPGARADLHAVEGDVSGLMVLKLVDAADQRGLAGAGRAAQHDALAPAHAQRDVVQRTEGAEIFFDAIHRDDAVIRRGHFVHAEI